MYSSGNTRGVDAFSEATTGTCYGVFADADAIDGGTGVHGRSDGSTGVNFGVRGEVFSQHRLRRPLREPGDGQQRHRRDRASPRTRSPPASRAPSSPAASRASAATASSASPTARRGYGVVGLQGPGAYAGYFVGNTHVTGTLSKSAGSFKIDHPLDPENKTLSHSFVESPDMKNIYDGQVPLDDDGGATVKLPAYFGALNRDFRYQLTAIGGAAPSLHIAAGGRGQPVRDRRRQGRA